MLPEGQKDKPPYTPMDMSPFEKRMLEYEKQERHMNKMDYLRSIQGVDGGEWHRDFKER